MSASQTQPAASRPADGRTAPPKARRARGPLLMLLALALVAGAGALLARRRALHLEQHLARGSALPFSPRGRPAAHPDGRLFLVTDGPQLLGLERDGALSFNKRLPAPVTPQPVLARADLLVLQAEGRLLGYSLGGEPRFSVEDDGAVGDVPCADERGALYLLDRSGRLAGFDAAGRARFQTTLGLRERRRVIALPTGQLLAAGSPSPGAAGELALAEPSGAVVLRRPLPAPPEGLAGSPFGDEIGAVSAGAEVLTLGPAGAPRRRLALPGPARGAPLLLANGAVYSLVRRGDGLALCRAATAPGAAAAVPGAPAAESTPPSPRGEPRCLELGAVPLPEDAPPPGPLLGRDGRVYAAFSAPGPLGATDGVLSLGEDGAAWRQALPCPIGAAGLALTWGGSVLILGEEERYLWELEGGGAGRYHPWPLPLGNPAAGGRPWPERP